MRAMLDQLMGTARNGELAKLIEKIHNLKMKLNFRDVLK